MSEHPIEGLMGVTMQKIKEMVDVNTIIGEPVITPDGTTIIPVSKVSFGFASGGTDLPTSQPKQTFGGGGGAGITLQPLAFLAGHHRQDFRRRGQGQGRQDQGVQSPQSGVIRMILKPPA